MPRGTETHVGAATTKPTYGRGRKMEKSGNELKPQESNVRINFNAVSDAVQVRKIFNFFCKPACIGRRIVVILLLASNHGWV